MTVETSVAPGAEPGSTSGRPRSGWRPVVRSVLRRLLAAVAAAAGLAVLSIASILLVVAVWPTDSRDVLGVQVEIGAQRPDAGFGAVGPGRLESFGQTVDVRAIRVLGPVRPYLGTTIGPYDLIRIATTPEASTAAGDALADAFLRWALARTPAVLAVGTGLFVATVAVGSFVGLLPPLDRQSRRRYASWTLTASGVVLAVWAASLASAAYGSQSLSRVQSLDEVFDYDVLRTAPAPAGAERTGYEVVVVGDSRVAVLGGDVVGDPSPDDEACGRSRDSLSQQIQQLLSPHDWDALNLACTGATVEDGLLQSQLVDGRRVPAQLGQLKRVADPEVVVVSIGPNDVYWAPIVGSCYVTQCNVTGLSPTVNALLASFSRSYDDLLADLADLESEPQVVVVGAYEPFAIDATCDDTRLPDGGGSLTDAELATIERWRERLNTILASGAEAQGFSYVEPALLPLCEPDLTGLGPDLWPLASDNRFHPTSVGVLKTAVSVVAAIEPDRLDDDAAVADAGTGSGPQVGVTPRDDAADRGNGGSGVAPRAGQSP